MLRFITSIICSMTQCNRDEEYIGRQTGDDHLYKFQVVIKTLKLD